MIKSENWAGTWQGAGMVENPLLQSKEKRSTKARNEDAIERRD